MSESEELGAALVELGHVVLVPSLAQASAVADVEADVLRRVEQHVL